MTAIEVLKYMLDKAESEVPESDRIIGLNVPVDIVREIIDAQPERKTGRWIKLDAHAHLADHKCTACGQECYVPTCMGEPMYAFCPNCGARMEDATNG